MEEKVQDVSLSIDETNALRLQLGLKPLELGPSEEEKQANRNFLEQQDKRKKEDELRQRLEKHKREYEKKESKKQLQGPKLSAADDEALDSPAMWIQRQKTQAAKNAQSVQAAEKSKPSPKSYTASELSGVTVDHSSESIREGETLVMTLKDKKILESDDDDELENAEIRKTEYSELVKKSKLPVYTGYDDDEFASIDGKRRVLAQYDEVINPKSKEKFVLQVPEAVQHSNSASVATAVDQNKVDRDSRARFVTRSLETLEFQKFAPMQDYVTEGELKIVRKSKNSSRANARKRESEADDPQLRIENAVVATNKNKDRSETNFVDDDDLQSLLTVVRQKASRKQATRVPTFEELESDMLEVKNRGDHIPIEEGAHTFDATREFVSKLNSKSVLDDVYEVDEVLKAAGSRKTDSPKAGAKRLRGSNDSDSEDSQEKTPAVKRSKLSGSTKSESKNTNLDINNSDEEFTKTAENPLEEEPVLDRGIAAAMDLLRKRGSLIAPNEEKVLRENEYQERLRWALANPMSKDKSRAAARARAKDASKRFETYTPNVNIEYTDERGRILSQKEAYKVLSHKFHGRSSGKNKIEKIMRKEEEQRRMMSMSGGDTPLNLASAMLEKQKQLGTPGILLAHGNKLAPVDTITNTAGSSSSNHLRK